jgi:prevent-host-death family protein
MPIETTDETSIGVTAFKAQCLGLINDVVQGKTSRVILTKHDRPVAALIPIASEKVNLDSLDDIWGALRHVQSIPEGVDITEPIAELWKAEQ